MQEPGSGITSASGWAGAATSTGGVCYMKKCYDRGGTFHVSDDQRSYEPFHEATDSTVDSYIQVGCYRGCLY